MLDRFGYWPWLRPVPPAHVEGFGTAAWPNKEWCKHKQIMCQHANPSGFCAMTACIVRQKGENHGTR